MARRRRPGAAATWGLAHGLALAALLLFMLGVVRAAPLPAQTWFDALVASVNGDPILASDVTVEDVLYGRGRTFATMDDAGRREVVTRLIRRRLLLGEAARFGVAQPGEAKVAEAVAALRARLGPTSEGIDPVAMADRVRERLRADAFVDARIRAFVLIRDAQVEAGLAGRPVPADPAAREALERRVRGELAERETAERLERYLAQLEGRATIRRFPMPALAF